MKPSVRKHPRTLLWVAYLPGSSPRFRATWHGAMMAVDDWYERENLRRQLRA